MPRGFSRVDQDAHHLVLARLHPLRQRLHDQEVAVAVDDQGRQAVALAVHEAQRGRARCDRLPEAQRGRDAVAHEVAGRRLVAVDHPQLDLGAGRVQRPAERPPLRPQHPHQRAGRGALRAADVALEDPGVSATDARFAARGDDDGSLGHDGIL
jgi:hypothetical protein